LYGNDKVHIEVEITIHRPVEVVFDFVADACNEPLYNSEMLHAEKITEGPVELGARFRTEVKSMGRPVEIQINTSILSTGTNPPD
jgi:hypothetical protein